VNSKDPDIAIKVENISKLYRLDKVHKDSFRDVSVSYLKNLFVFSKNKEEQKRFWALKDISFELKKGEALGIIGSNGAGKSTLLKILSEVVVPTSGKVEINGNLASVLDMGMGFHPDLSGRENVYLSGQILGMSRQTINQKFDEIVSFSEIEQFIDTPVKHYSSGMYIRLTFSIIVNISAEILVFDEVLSVGDEAFKIKSLKKMKELICSGKSVILISHNLSEIQTVCENTILLEKGRIKMMGNSKTIIDKYIDEINERQKRISEANI
jgi:lipopolysaccharide transport system ATP-binding protein